MTHRSVVTGTAVLVASWLLIGALVASRAPPAIAAAIWIAAIPDPVIFGIGYAAAADWGHDKYPLLDVFGKEVDMTIEEECNPFHPNPLRRCKTEQNPFNF